MITVIAGIIMLGILVFVHEFGHFCIAKLSGVKVLKFSLGFGPRLVSYKWGETEYMICAVPLGGYVQMLGEGGGEEGEEKVSELPPEDRSRSYAEQSVGRRTAIIAAGPIMNLILPFLILPIAFMAGVSLPAFLNEEPCIGYVVPESTASQAGFQGGDCLQAVNGDTVSTWSEANTALFSHAGVPLHFTVLRNGQQTTVTIHPDDAGVEGLQPLGLLPPREARVGALAPGMPAEEAGLQVGDEIVAIGGVSTDSWYDLKRILQESGGEPQEIAVKRGEETLEFTLKPRQMENNGDEYLIGIAPHQEVETKRYGPWESIKAGADRTWELTSLTMVFLKKLFTGDVSTSNIGGPITVVQIAGQAAQTDLASILSVLAFLSIQLGILNLLPIPILDGGHLFFNLFEILFRRPLSTRSREIAQQIGLILILMLMVLAFYNDIMRIFLGGIP